MDHTLWDFDKNSALTFDKIFRQHQLDIVLEDFLKFYEPINLEYWKLYREERIDKASLRYGRLSDTFEKIGFNSNDALINRLSEDYITNLSSFNYLFEGTISILDYLQTKYRLHIITNGFAEAQQKKLENSKIDGYFLTVTNSEMVGVKKPNPKIFNFAIESADVLPENSLMIGDNLEADVMGALDFGMDAICFNIHDQTLNNDIKQIKNLLELKQYL